MGDSLGPADFPRRMQAAPSCSQDLHVTCFTASFFLLSCPSSLFDDKALVLSLMLSGPYPQPVCESRVLVPVCHPCAGKVLLATDRPTPRLSASWTPMMLPLPLLPYPCLCENQHHTTSLSAWALFWEVAPLPAFLGYTFSSVPLLGRGALPSGAPEPALRNGDVERSTQSLELWGVSQREEVVQAACPLLQPPKA